MHGENWYFQAEHSYFFYTKVYLSDLKKNKVVSLQNFRNSSTRTNFCNFNYVVLIKQNCVKLLKGFITQSLSMLKLTVSQLETAIEY